MRDAFLGSKLFMFPNGKPITPDIIFSAQKCDIVSMSVLQRSVVAFFEGTIYQSLSRLGHERDMLQKRWFSTPTTMAKHYSALLMRDWVLYGDGSEQAFHDMAADYTRNIIEAALSFGESPSFDRTLKKYHGHILPVGIIPKNDERIIVAIS